MGPSVKPSERRRVHRFALRLSAMVRERGRGRMPVRVIDISTHGSRIELSCGLLIGSWVWLSIAGLDTIYAKIVWCRDGFAGLEFTTPIHDSVLDTLLKQHDNASEDDIKQLRDIAKRTRMLSAQSEGYTASEEMAELSRDCVTGALLDGLGLGKSGAGKSGGGKRLSGAMIKRPAPDQQA